MADRISQEYLDAAIHGQTVRESQIYLDVAVVQAIPGRTSQIYLDVAIPNVAEEPDFIDGIASEPLGWQLLLDRGLTWRPFAEVDLNDAEHYYGGYKRPSILEFYEITSGLSDRLGQIEHLVFGARHSDTDRFWRTLLDDPTLKFLTNRPLMEHVINDDSRRQEGVPMLVANGFVSDYSELPNLQFRIIGTDWLKKKYSRSRGGQLAWQPKIPLVHFPNCPPEVVDTPAPVIYGIPADDIDGVVSNSGAVVMDIESGVPGGFYQYSRGLAGQEMGGVGSFFLEPAKRSYGVLPGNTVPSVTMTAGGAGGIGPTRNDSWSAMVVAIHTGGIVADPSPIANVVLDWASGQRSFTVNWTAPSGPEPVTYDVYVTNNPFGVVTTMSTHFTPFHVASDYVWKFTVAGNLTTLAVTGPGADYTFQRVYLYQVTALFGGGTESSPSGVVVAMSHPYERPIHLRWREYVGATVLGYRIRRADYTGVGTPPNWTVQFDVGPTGVNGAQVDPSDGLNRFEFFDDFTATPPGTTAIQTGTARLPTGGTHRAIPVGVVTVGAFARPAFLIARHACQTPVRSIFQDGQVIASADPRWGVTIWAPGFPGWPFATSYIDIAGVRYTMLFADGEIASSAQDGSKPLMVNTAGVETNGDGSGTVIESLALQALHFAVNYLAPDIPETGSWLPSSPSFAAVPGLHLVNEASFYETQAATVTRLPGGYTGAGIIGGNGEDVSAEDALARFCVSGDFEMFFNRRGQLCLTSEPIVSPAEPVAFDDVVNILANTFTSTEHVTSEFFNVLPYVDSRDYSGRANSGWFSRNEGVVDIHDDTSISQYEQEIQAGTYELHFCWRFSAQGLATILSVMGHKLRRTTNPKRQVTFVTSLSGTTIQPGQAFQVSHVEGIGASGWNQHWVRASRHGLSITKGQVMIDCYDLDPAGAFSRRLPFIASTVVMFAPSVTYSKVLALPTIAGTALFAPSVAAIAVLSLPQISTTALYAPTVALV